MNGRYHTKGLRRCHSSLWLVIYRLQACVGGRAISVLSAITS